MKSIVKQAPDKCLLCDRYGTLYNPIEEHHIYGNHANRKLSTRYGLTVRICRECHHERVHKYPNQGDDLELKIMGQRLFKRHYPDLDFLEIFGRNYL